jgi:NADH dehydrogenase FAD-containing subunit
VKSYESSRVNFKQGKLSNVLSDENQIEITTMDDEKETIPYDCLVIVTGASYVSPWKAQ